MRVPREARAAWSWTGDDGAARHLEAEIWPGRERGEISELGQPAGVLLGERRELLALDEFAGLGEALRREGRIHLIEHPVVDDRGDLAVGGEGDLALDRHPHVGMRVRGRRRRQAD